MVEFSQDTELTTSTLTNDQDLDPDFNLFQSNLKETICTPIYDTSSFISAGFSPDSFSVMSLNIRSTNKNIDELKIFLHKLKYDFDVLCLQETWSKDDYDFSVNSSDALSNYRALNLPRSTHKRGGGLCTYIKRFKLKVK